MNKIFYMIPMVLQMFLPCYYGEIIMQQSRELLSSAFQSSWPDESITFRKAMTIFMESAKRPIRIIGVGIFEVSLSNFVAVCKSAYSLYAVFKTVNE